MLQDHTRGHQRCSSSESLGLCRLIPDLCVSPVPTFSFKSLLSAIAQLCRLQLDQQGIQLPVGSGSRQEHAGSFSVRGSHASVPDQGAVAIRP
jgi:hypothetical protein